MQEKLKDITDLLSMSQAVEGPTRIISASQTQTDLVFTITPLHISKGYN